MTSRNRFPSRPARLAFACTSLLAVLGVGTLRSQPASQPSAKQDSTLQVANALDGVIQQRFLQNAGLFGLTRVVPVVNGHPIGYIGTLGTETPTEKQVLARAAAARRDYAIAFLHCAHVPGQFVRPGVFKPAVRQGKVPALKPWLSTLIVTRDPSPTAQKVSAPLTGYTQLQEQWQAAALRSLPTLQHGSAVQAAVADWTVVMRPVTASDGACVSCHVGAKRGDTLGVMVYAVRNTISPATVASAHTTL